MKNCALLLFLISTLFYAQNPSEQIRINQVGYLEKGEKIFVVSDLPDKIFELLDESKKVVFKRNLEEKGVWDKSGEKVTLGNFSTYSKPGKYTIKVGNHVSYAFEIGNDIYRGVKNAALKSYYLQRISMPIEEQYAGIFKREKGHDDIGLLFHSSANKSGSLDTPGGWYDAGDYGKYMINAGIATGIMLSLAENYPDAFPDNSLNIPESGNNIPDILDELKYEIDWMLTMQDEDGGAFVKVTTLNFCGMVMPSEAPKDRLVIGKSTAAALHLAAIGAMASRIYTPYLPEYANKCLLAAEKAWEWANKNPTKYYAQNPEDVKTGPYNDTDLNEEFFWANSELYATTKKGIYYNKIKSKLSHFTLRLEENWRNYNDNIGYYSLVNKKSPLPENDKKVIENRLVFVADSLASVQKSIPYQIPIDHFVWGSNSDVLDAAIIFAQAYELTKRPKYLKAVNECSDYVLGKNATGYSFVTGFGSKQAMRIHHRPSVADGIDAPYPGFLVGGPNFHMQDKGSLAASGFSYASELPAKSYIDEIPSFASNEICINWNAPLVYVSGFLDHYNDQNQSP
ncbi:glycoside hydrolase family 9 protein [Namhaeicola litoreus]|uniref:Glycoside hydrolase family 9 protein n=1 Tax=Namhaeicola litoreus TaxID=1052145 RepID=A0ABW3Y3B6_9FLAO